MEAPGKLRDDHARRGSSVSAARGETAVVGTPDALPEYPPPSTRPLQIFAFDPMMGRAEGNRVTVQIANVDVQPGPSGPAIQVVDYDGSQKCFYWPVDLDDPRVLMRGGLEPSEADPRFHQQMVFAVATKVIENFERALGRRIRFRRRGRKHGAGFDRLRLFPHAFRGANAYYDRDLLGIVFGYFTADPVNPGENLPGQTVFTCLSHDIIAHEMTHALVDRLRPHYLEPTNRDMLAFHEAIADVVAIFQHFSFDEVLRDTIQETRHDLRSPTPLVTLAQQFGHATGSGAALRAAGERDRRPDPTLYRTAFQAHERGSVLVAAVFDGFFTTYQRRVEDLLRLATGGSGRLPEGALHPDLVNRLAHEAAKTAQSVLTMCIRAFEYLPPVDVTFGDFLRALVTADAELVSTDRLGQRPAMIEAFRLRGIYPDDVVSLSEESLRWPDRRRQSLREHWRLPVVGHGDLLELWNDGRDVGTAGGEWDEEPELEPEAEGGGAARAATVGRGGGEIARALHAFATEYASALRLDLDPDREVVVEGFHPVFRVSPEGQVYSGVVVQYVQTADEGEATGAGEGFIDGFGGVQLRGGTTVVAADDGTIRYVVSKPLPFRRPKEHLERPGLTVEERERLERREARADRRLQRLAGYVDEADLDDPLIGWAGKRYITQRMLERANMASIHRALWSTHR